MLNGTAQEEETLFWFYLVPPRSKDDFILNMVYVNIYHKTTINTWLIRPNTHWPFATSLN